MRCHRDSVRFSRLGTDPGPESGTEVGGTFDAPLPLKVLFRAPGGAPWQPDIRFGETPTADGAGVPIPAGTQWGIEPAEPDLDDGGFAEVTRILRERGVPGLHLPSSSRLSDRGLASLAGIPTLRWLAFECADGVTREGLAVLRSLPGLTDLDLGELPECGDEIGALRNLEFLRANCGGLAEDGFAALASCSSLRFLDLDATRTKDADLRRMPSLPRLEEFHLGTFGRTSAALSTLERHPNLRCVGLGDLPLDAAAIDALARLPRIEHLHGFRYPERKEEMRDLGRLGGLRLLDGGYPPPGPRDLPYLARLPFLEELDLDGTQVRDEDLVHVCRLPSLRCLVLRNTWTTDAGLAHLAGLRGIEALDLSLLKITDAGLACLEGRGNLRWLGLDLCTEVTGRGLAHLPADSALAYLSASGSGIDAAGLAALARLPALRWTNLNRTKVPPEALREFLQARGNSLAYGDSVAD